MLSRKKFATGGIISKISPVLMVDTLKRFDQIKGLTKNDIQNTIKIIVKNQERFSYDIISGLRNHSTCLD